MSGAPTVTTQESVPPIFARPSSFQPAPAGPRLASAGPLGWAAIGLVLVAYVASLAVGSASVLGVVVVVAATLATVPWFARIGRLRPDLELAGLLRLSLAVKLLATLPRFETREDSVDYHRVGSKLADSFRRFDFIVDTGRDIPGTGSVRYATGLVEVGTFEDEFATFVVFSLFGFVGVVWFLRAFMTALPAIDPRRYALLLLFWPSLIYWPSSIGKDALMLAGLAAAARGVAAILQSRVHGLAWAIPGLILCSLVRPHVALIAVTAAVCALILRGPGHGDRSSGVALRLLVIGGLLIAGALASDAVEALFDIDGLNPTGLSAALDLANSRSTQGGSSFTAARIDGLSDYPWGLLTVLFRPFPHEAGSLPMLVTSIESLVLAGLTFAAAPRFFAALGRIRKEAYAAYAVAFVAVFVYLFSAIGNFGILARQRTMMIPLLLAVVALPTARERIRQRRLEVAP